jgi:hypothetical protein
MMPRGGRRWTTVKSFANVRATRSEDAESRGDPDVVSATSGRTVRLDVIVDPPPQRRDGDRKRRVPIGRPVGVMAYPSRRRPPSAAEPVEIGDLPTARRHLT